MLASYRLGESFGGTPSAILLFRPETVASAKILRENVRPYIANIFTEIPERDVNRRLLVTFFRSVIGFFQDSHRGTRSALECRLL